MDEHSRLALSLLITGGIGFIIMGVRFFVLESLEKAYCECTHEFNDHWVFPAGMTPQYFGVQYEHEECKKCGCHGFKKADKDPRNSKPTKFFP